MTKISISIFIMLFALGILNAQDEQPKTNPIQAYSISLRLIGPPTMPLGISYGQMLTERLSVEMGVGILSFGSGFEYFITNPRKHRFNLYTGAYGSVFYDGGPMFYLPFGVSYLGEKSFEYSIDAGVLYEENSILGNSTSPWFGLTISKRFGQDVETLKGEKQTELLNVISTRFGFVFPVIGINYERLLSPNLGLEASIGFIGASAGVNVYFPSIKPGKIGFKTGLTQGVLINPLAGVETSTYIPIGISYLSKSRNVLSVDFGPQYWYGDQEFLPGFSVRIGKAF